MDYLGNEQSMGLNKNSQFIHPLEESQRTHLERQEKSELKMSTKIFGLGFALHRQHERAAASCPQVGHIGLLKRHNAMHQALTGQDLDFDFSDTLAIEREFNIPTSNFMDKIQSHPLCKK